MSENLWFSEVFRRYIKRPVVWNGLMGTKKRFHCICKQQKKVWNMFKVDNKNTRTMSMSPFLCFYCWFSVTFTPFSIASIVDFQQNDVRYPAKLALNTLLCNLWWWCMRKNFMACQTICLHLKNVNLLFLLN